MSKQFVMFIHGYIGNPSEFDVIKKLFEDQGIATHSFYLAGHKYKKKKYDRKEWIKDCDDKLSYLKEQGHEQIIIVGHSMGGLLGINLALNNPDTIKKVVLFAPAFDYLVRKNKRVKIIHNLERLNKASKQIDFSHEKHEPSRLNMSALNQFRKLVAELGNKIYELKCPILIVQGEKDYLVPTKKVEDVYNKIPVVDKELIIVQEGSHWCLSEKLSNDINQKIISFIKK